MAKSTFGCALIVLLPLLAPAITIDLVTVGDPGNPADQTTGLGSVDYTYAIGKFEVQNSEYAAFLNAVASRTDPYGVYNSRMGTDPLGGIARTGAGTALNPYVYSTRPNMGDKPVDFISVYDAVRFVNWLENGQPIGRQGTNTTEMGSYTLFTDGSATTNMSTRVAGATWAIPSENEWYKAAYYDPGPTGPAGDYWIFPTRSDSAPTAATADAMGVISNPGANVANYNMGAGWNGQVGNVTTVGSAGPLSASYYGTFDQGGNLEEINETIADALQGDRQTRGGNWGYFDGYLASWNRAQVGSTTEEDYFGFRVAMIPEPRALVALAVVGLAAWVWRRRRR